MKQFRILGLLLTAAVAITFIVNVSPALGNPFYIDHENRISDNEDAIADHEDRILELEETGTGELDLDSRAALCALLAGTIIPAPQSLNCPKLVFVTNDEYNGNLGGVAGADAICQSSAEAAGLSGTFMAWISDSTTSPETSFVKSTTGYMLRNGSVVATSWTDLTDGDIAAAINITELGTQNVGVVWTDTLPDGTSATGMNNSDACNDWTSNSTTNTAHMGINSPAIPTEDIWTYRVDANSPRGCDSYEQLYCFEQ